jgi:hypothetical protein
MDPLPASVTVVNNDFTESFENAWTLPCSLSWELNCTCSANHFHNGGHVFLSEPLFFGSAE